MPFESMRTLTPSQANTFLPVSEVVRRATAEFGFVVTDESRGMRYLAEKMIARNDGFDQRRADDELTPLSDCVEMILGDDRRSDERFLKCYVVPDAPIEVVYVFDGHEFACSDLLERLIRVLGYSSETE